MNVNEIIIPLMESRTQFYRMLHNLYRRPLSEEGAGCRGLQGPG